MIEKGIKERIVSAVWVIRQETIKGMKQKEFLDKEEYRETVSRMIDIIEERGDIKPYNVYRLAGGELPLPKMSNKERTMLHLVVAVIKELILMTDKKDIVEMVVERIVPVERENEAIQEPVDNSGEEAIDWSKRTLVGGEMKGSYIQEPY